MKFECIKSMPKLKAEIIRYLFDFVGRKPHNEWYQYKGQFNYEGETYELECKCKWDNQMFTYRDLFIERKQIVIDMDEMVRHGIVGADEVKRLQ